MLPFSMYFFNICILSSANVLMPFLLFYIVCICIYVNMSRGPHGRLASVAKCTIFLK